MSEVAELVERILDLTDGGNFRACERLIHPRCDIVMSGAGRLTREGLTGYNQLFAMAFPEAEHVVERILESQGSVVVEGTWVATQTGPFMTPQGPIPPTGRTMSTRFCMVVRVLDGEAVSIHGYWDQLEMLQQLGLVQEPSAV